MGKTGRFLLRTALTGIAAVQASLLTVALSSESFSTNDFVVAGLLGLGASLAYAGIGAAVPQVEPHVGNEL